MNNSDFNLIRRIRQKVKEGLLLLSFLTLTFIIISGTCFAQDYQKDWFYNPFNQYSAHHRPIGTGAIYASEDHPAVQDWFKASQINIILGSSPWGLYMVDADEDGPMMTVNKRRETGTSGLPTVMRFPTGGVDIEFPIHNDGNMTVYDRTINVFNHLRVYSWNDGNPLAVQYRSYKADSEGQGTKLADRIGTSASGVAAPFGILRGWEVNKTGHPIGHALQMALPRKPENSVMMLGREVWWPAVGMDGGAYTNAAENTGNIPYGSLWAIPPVSKGGPDLDTLGLTEKGKRLAEAIRDYGIYVVDGGGGTSIRADQNFSTSTRNELVAETRKFHNYIRLVVNSVPDEGKVKFNVGDKGWAPSGPIKQIIPGEFPAGGGEPLAPNTAINAVSSSKKVVYPNNGLFEGMRVFPNPTNDKITLRFDKLPVEEVEIELFNILGQVAVKAQKVTQPVTSIILPDEQTIYYVRITSNHQSKTIRVIRL